MAGKIAILHGWLGSQYARRQWRSDRCGMDGAGPEVTEQRCCINHRLRCSKMQRPLGSLRWGDGDGDGDAVHKYFRLNYLFFKVH